MSQTQLGLDAQTGNPVEISDDDRVQGFYVIGRPGTGKTTLLLNLIQSDIEAGDGVCVFDPHGDAIQDIIARLPTKRLPDVVLLDPTDYEYPFGLNLFECDDPSNPILSAQVSSAVVQTFKKLWATPEAASWGPRLEDLLRNATLTLMENQGYTLAELPLLLEDADFRARLIAKVTNIPVLEFWRNTYNALTRPQDQINYRDSTLNKVRELLTQPIALNIFGQSKTTFNLRELMDDNRIVLVSLPRGKLGDELVNLLGSILVQRLLQATMSREDIPPEERTRFYLYADEYQRFSTAEFATLIDEARKFGLVTTIAHQRRSQLDEDSRGAASNPANTAVFQVAPQDAQVMAGAFNASPPDPPIIGYRPTPAISQHPYNDLVRGSHPDPRIRELVLKNLGLIERAIDLYNDTARMTSSVRLRDPVPFNPRVRSNGTPILPFTYFDIPSVVSPTLSISKMGDYKNVAKAINAHFTAMMEHKFVIGSEEESRSIKKALTLRDGVLCVRIVDAITEIGRYLYHNPLMVRTAVMEPIYDRPRSYADVQNQIATTLANLPNYVARVRLMVGGAPVEHTINTIQANPGLTGQALKERTQAIRELTRGRYCVARVLVENQLVERRQAPPLRYAPISR